MLNELIVKVNQIGYCDEFEINIKLNYFLKIKIYFRCSMKS